MRVLAFDTAFNGYSIALAEKDVCNAASTLREGNIQAERLVPAIEGLMQEAGTSYSALDAIVITIGPGSFIGLRVGLATARGLALAADKPLIGVSTLEAVAFQASGTSPLSLPREGKPGGHASEQEEVKNPVSSTLASFDARRGKVYAQLFQSDMHPLSEPALLDIEEAAALARSQPSCLLCGTGNNLIAEQLKDSDYTLAEGPDVPEALPLARYGILQRERAAKGSDVRPLYLRPPDAKLPKAS